MGSKQSKRSSKIGKESSAVAPAPAPTYFPNTEGHYNSFEDSSGSTLPQQGISRTASQAFRAGSSEAVQAVLTRVEALAQKRVRDGFSEFNFSLGVLNCFLVTFIFCAYPQHFWILFLAESCVLFPLKIVTLSRTKPLNNVLYLLDYCWVTNMAGTIFMFLILFSGDSLPESFREQFFLAAYGSAIGPLFASNIAFSFIAIIFHDVHAMASVFIHLFPSLLFFNLRWKSEEVHNAWSNVFHLQHDIDFWPSGSFTGNVFSNSLLTYLAWYIPYFTWQYFVGIDLPRKNRHKKLPNGDSAPALYDTVFHSTLRDGKCVVLGKLFWKRSVEDSKKQVADNDFELRDFFAYMAMHLTAAVLAICCLAYPCYLSPYVHGTSIVLLLVVCTWRGAKRYTYYSTKMYSSVIRKHFAKDIEDATLEAGAAVP